MDTDFPVIEDPVAAAPAPAQALATQQPGGELSLETFDLKKVALAYFGPWRANVTETKVKLTGVEHDLTTPTKIAEVKSLRHRLINVPLATARATSEALKKKLNGTKTDVVSELEAIEAGYAEAAKLITPQIEAAEAKLAEEKRVAAEKEAARVEAHREALAKLAAPAERALLPEMTAERIAKGIELVEAIVIDRPAWEEFADRAEEQKAVTLERMRALHTKAVAAEAEAARLAAEKAEAERVAAANKAEADRLAALAADLARQQAELKAAQDRAAAEAQARADEAARVEREQQESIARAAQAEREEQDRLQREAADLAAKITQDAQESDFVPGTPGPCASSEAESAQASPSGSGTAVLADIGTVSSVAPAPEVRAFVAPAAPAVAELPTLTLGQISTRLGFTVTADFLAGLGFEAHKEKASRLYRPSLFPAICEAISAHVLLLGSEAKKAA